jgi:uroporphyrinogen-III synthase
VVEVPVYDIVFDEEKIREAVSAVSAAKAVVLTSSTIAEIMASRVDLTGKIVVAIGAVTSKKLRELGVPHVVAEEATIESAVKTALRNWEKSVG